MSLRICSGVMLIALAGVAQTESASDPLLARIRQKTAEVLAGVPNYTCVETVNRASRPQLDREFEPIALR